MAKRWLFVIALVCCEASTGKNNVLIWSTLELILGTTKDGNWHKLGLYKLYDFTKGRTDIIVQRMVFHKMKTKYRKWTLVMFAYILDTARVNSSTVFALNQGKGPIKERFFEYTYQILLELAKPTIKIRTKFSCL